MAIATMESIRNALGETKVNPYPQWWSGRGDHEKAA